MLIKSINFVCVYKVSKKEKSIFKDYKIPLLNAIVFKRTTGRICCITTQAKKLFPYKYSVKKK